MTTSEPHYSYYHTDPSDADKDPNWMLATPKASFRRRKCTAVPVGLYSPKCVDLV